MNISSRLILLYSFILVNFVYLSPVLGNNENPFYTFKKFKMEEIISNENVSSIKMKVEGEMKQRGVSRETRKIIEKFDITRHNILTPPSYRKFKGYIILDEKKLKAKFTNFVFPICAVKWKNFDFIILVTEKLNQNLKKMGNIFEYYVQIGNNFRSLTNIKPAFDWDWKGKNSSIKDYTGIERKGGFELWEMTQNIKFKSPLFEYLKNNYLILDLYFARKWEKIPNESILQFINYFCQQAEENAEIFTYPEKEFEEYFGNFSFTDVNGKKLKTGFVPTYDLFIGMSKYGNDEESKKLVKANLPKLLNACRTILEKDKESKIKLIEYDRFFLKKMCKDIDEILQKKSKN